MLQAGRGFANVYRRSCLRRTTQLQAAIAYATKLAAIQRRVPPELQRFSAGATMVAHRSCKAVLPKLQVANTVAVGAATVLQACRRAQPRCCKPAIKHGHSAASPSSSAVVMLQSHRRRSPPSLDDASGAAKVLCTGMGHGVCATALEETTTGFSPFSAIWCGDGSTHVRWRKRRVPFNQTRGLSFSAIRRLPRQGIRGSDPPEDAQ
jgi:hypothetical protein